MKLSEYLHIDGIVLDLPGGDKKEILVSLVDSLTRFISIGDKDKIVGLLEEREALSTTGIGFEVAIPHCKTPEVSGLKIVIARSNSGIDFDALDGKPVRLFFLLVAPEQSSTEHLKALAKIARLAKDETIRQKLLTIESPEAIIAFIAEQEDDFS